MSIVEVVILGAVQGLTEFIPVSSSGHLVILHELLGLSDGGLAMDVALHIGTLGALLVYFWKDIVDLIQRLFEGKKRAKLPLLLGFACIPAVIAGVLLQEFAESTFRHPILVAANLAVFGGIMFLAEKYASRRKTEKAIEEMTARQALAIGSFQALAIVPGVSRSGSTITGGLFFGLDKVAATRFSFLLAIPITFGAILKLALDGSFNALSQDLAVVVTGIVTAFISGLIAIRFLLKFIARYSVIWFFYYRLSLAIFILLVVYYKS